jgi:antitoxin CptB
MRALDNPGGEARAGRLRWRCRRGMRELDVLLERALGRLMPESSDAQWRAFEQLLDLPDPLLAGYFLGGKTPPEPALAQLVERIRALCRSGDPAAVFCSESHSGQAC